MENIISILISEHRARDFHVGYLAQLISSLKKITPHFVDSSVLDVGNEFIQAYRSGEI